MRVVIFAVACLLIACVDAPSTSETSQTITASNKIVLNKIILNKIILNKIILNKIILNKIILNKIILNGIETNEFALDTAVTHDLLNGDDDDRAVLEYLISCAFPENVALSGRDDGGTLYTFQGGAALAPKWGDRKLNTKERRWVSACMLARVNKDATEVEISLRGPHDALVVTADERTEFDLEEGAFYGDIFADPQQFYACRGASLYTGDMSFESEGRGCAIPDGTGKTLCGMTFAGNCAAFDATGAACRDDGEYYGRCHTSAAVSNQGHATRFEEAITVWIKPR